ncbi:MAG TPA: TetR/AcrR family transcriptional regulator [Verrucomicrobiae bacterium]|jgi:AcrR family transcriptional regulator|nr:TetR/AcrR family transcriptional regulator [Verrucomicrobiae bacterium]
MPRKKDPNQREHLLEACLAAFLRAGTLDLSLDKLARSAKTSKRMLVHYFGSREALEEMAMSRLEDGLRSQFRAGAFPPATTLHLVVRTLWEQITAPRARGLLQVTMDLTRRSWTGSERGRRFFAEQQRLWAEMLSDFFPHQEDVGALLLLFQGAALVYLATGDASRGWRALERFVQLETRSTADKAP